MPSFDLIRHVNRASADYEQDRPVYPGSEEDKDALDNIEIERHYRASQEDWAQEAQKSENHVHNIMFTKEQVDALAMRGQAATPINVIWPAVEQAVAMLTTQKPRFQATAREDSDVKTGRVISDLLSWVWEQSSGNERLKNAVYDYYVKGRGVLHAYIDPTKDFGKGEVCIMDLDPLDVYPDPNSCDRLWRDAAHILTSQVMTREAIELMWPETAHLMEYADSSEADYASSSGEVATNGQILKGDVTDSYHERYRVITRYTKVKVQYNSIVEMFSDEEYVLMEEELEEYFSQPAAIVSSEEGEQIVTDEELQPWMERFAAGEPTQDERVRIFTEPEQQLPTGETVPAQQYQIALVDFSMLLEMGQITQKPFLETRIRVVVTVGGRLYYKGFLPISEYPLVPFNNRHNRNPYPMSDVQFVVPIQEQINKQQALITANLASSTNVKAWVPKGSVDKDQMEIDFAKAGAAILEYDAEFGAPVIAQPVPMPGAAFTHFQSLIQMVQHEMGIHPLMGGDSSAAPSTHKATIAIEQFGQRRIRAKLDDIENALNHMATHITVPLMQVTYTERKVVRLIEPNNTVRESIANQLQYDQYGRETIEKAMDITAGRYDAIVVSGSTLPSNRFALLDVYTNLYEKGIIDQVEVLKKTDVADAEGVIERHSMMSQMQQQMQQMEEQIKGLQGDLQTREREVYHSKVELEVEKAKSKIGKQSNRVEMASMLNEARQRDELALSGKELDLAKREMKVQENSVSSVKKPRR